MLDGTDLIAIGGVGAFAASIVLSVLMGAQQQALLSTETSARDAHPPEHLNTLTKITHATPRRGPETPLRHPAP